MKEVNELSLMEKKATVKVKGIFYSQHGAVKNELARNIAQNPEIGHIRAFWQAFYSPEGVYNLN